MVEVAARHERLAVVIFEDRDRMRRRERRQAEIASSRHDGAHPLRVPASKLRIGVHLSLRGNVAGRKYRIGIVRSHPLGLSSAKFR
jgi:hypothetical protein